MLRTIEYTFSENGITPYSPQFAGIQGENGATKLQFTPSDSFAAELAELQETYDTLYYRFDCVDGADRSVTGTVEEYGEDGLSLTLSDELTCAGGTLQVCLILSGENNESANGTVLYSFPVTLYFKDFPFHMGSTERGDLNHAVKQIGEIRQEIYSMAQSAQQVCDENSERVEQIETLSAAASDSAESAASYAATSLTNAVTASGYAEQARQSAASASGSLTQLLALVGNINAVLATLVDAA